MGALAGMAVATFLAVLVVARRRLHQGQLEYLLATCAPPIAAAAVVAKSDGSWLGVVPMLPLWVTCVAAAACVNRAASPRVLAFSALVCSASWALAPPHGAPGLMPLMLGGVGGCALIIRYQHDVLVELGPFLGLGFILLGAMFDALVDRNEGLLVVWLMVLLAFAAVRQIIVSWGLRGLVTLVVAVMLAGAAAAKVWSTPTKQATDCSPPHDGYVTF